RHLSLPFPVLRGKCVNRTQGVRQKNAAREPERGDVRPSRQPTRTRRWAMRPRHAAAVALVTIVIAVVLGAAPASACGGLVGENGTIRLDRTSTLAGYHDGVEHYITSFSFTGEGQEVGSIIPLP